MAIQLSPKEQELLDVIPTDGSKISSRDLLPKIYGDDQPFNAKPILVGRLKSLSRKLEAMGHGQRLMRTELRGPHPMEVWLVPKP